MKIGLDFDGVIADCGNLKSKGAWELYRVLIPPEKFKKEILVGEKILTSAQYSEVQHLVYNTYEMGLLMEPVEGVLRYIPRLIDEGHTVRIITSRQNESLAIAAEWALKQGLLLDFTGVGYGRSKATAAKGVDVYIDDDLEKLEPLVGVVPNRYLFSWGYNEHIDVSGVANRIASWEEFYSTIQQLDNGR